ncbi:MAG: HPr family phosphocarrier protein [Pseudomonadota bacterium]
MTSRSSISVLITNKRGLHARASAKFCTEASKYNAKVTVSRDGISVGGCSIMGLLTLGAGPGTTIEIASEGPEANEALKALNDLVTNRFGEDV